MEELLWNIINEHFEGQAINVVQSEDGTPMNDLPQDHVNIVYTVLSKDFHYETINGLRIKHSQAIFRVEPSIDHTHDGSTLARLKGSTIYLLFSWNEGADSVLEAILQDLVPKAKEDIANSLIHQFKTSISSAIEARVQEYRDRIKQNNEEAGDMERQVLNLRRQIHTDSQALQALDGTKGQWIQKAHKEFDNLQHLIPNYYEGFRLEDDKLIAKTHEVSIAYDGCSYDIGVFEVKITLATGDLEIANLTHEVDGYQHPHISDGRPCLGNIGKGVIRMLAEFELFGALQMIHSFLHSYNEDSPYQKIEHWDPNHEDEEDSRYSNCRDNNSGYACVECGGEGGECPFYDEAFEVCVENSSLEDCTNCEYQCRLGRERIQRHRSNQQQPEVQAA